MSGKYFVSGDRTGITYGVHMQVGTKFDLNNTKMVRSGIKSLKEAIKISEQLDKKYKKNNK